MSPETQTIPESSTAVPPLHEIEGTIDLVELARALWLRRRTIIGWTLGVGLLAVIWAYSSRPVYESFSSILPPPADASEGRNVLLVDRGTDSSLLAGGEVKNISELYIAILQSYVVQTDVVNRCKLLDAFHTKSMDAAIARLSASTKLNSMPSTSIIQITVRDHDPYLAQKIVQGYLDALHALNSRLALTNAAQRRAFFQEQLRIEKDALENAEVDLKKVQEATGLVAPGSQTSSELQSMMQTRSILMERQTQLAALLLSATDQNPEVVRLRAEIASLESQLARMRQGAGPDISGALPTSKMPEAQLDVIRKQREVNYHEMLYQMLAKQLEAARLDESHSAPLLQIIDPPRLPNGPAGPNRKLRIFGGLGLGFFFSAAWVILSGPFSSTWKRITR